MVPFADQINHENVTVNYDCLDPATGETLMSMEEKVEKRRLEEESIANKKKGFLTDLKNDLEELSEQMTKHGMIDPKKASEHNTWRIQTKKEQIPDKALIDKKTDKLKHELLKEAEEQNEEEVLSSGLESDNDIDLLVEQEVLTAMRVRRELKLKFKQEEE